MQRCVGDPALNGIEGKPLQDVLAGGSGSLELADTGFFVRPHRGRPRPCTSSEDDDTPMSDGHARSRRPFWHGWREICSSPPTTI